MGKFGVTFTNFATATSAKTALALDCNAAGERGELVYLAAGGAAVTPASKQHEVWVAKCTFATAGTAGSSPTPAPFDEGAAAADLLAGIEFSAEPTVIDATDGAYPLYEGFNQYGGMKWGVPQGEGIFLSNAYTKRGICVRCLSDAVGAISGCGHWWEP